jgi:hypothetical protein
MKIYIAGPMTGIPEFNFPAFHAAASDWRREGWEVVNPAEMDEAIDGFNAKTDAAKSHEHYMKRDIPLVCSCDALALLPGWERSRGVQNEVAVARMCGLAFYHAETFVRFDPFAITETILQEAQRLVHGDRGADYGHPIDDYARTGRMWGAILGIPDIDPRLCCLMMGAMKISRETNKHKRDNLTDLAGYAECADMIAQRKGL